MRSTNSLIPNTRCKRMSSGGLRMGASMFWMLAAAHSTAVWW